MNTRQIALVAAGAIVVLDQLTKWWVVATLPGDPIVVIDGFLTLRYVTNSGAAFGMLEGAGSIIALRATPEYSPEEQKLRANESEPAVSISEQFPLDSP